MLEQDHLVHKKKPHRFSRNTKCNSLSMPEWQLQQDFTPWNDDCGCAVLRIRDKDAIIPWTPPD